MQRVSSIAQAMPGHVSTTFPQDLQPAQGTCGAYKSLLTGPCASLSVFSLETSSRQVEEGDGEGAEDEEVGGVRKSHLPPSAEK